jgi:hypothetical protein
MAADPKWPREQPAEIELLGKSGIMRRPVRGAYHYIHNDGGRVVGSSEMEDEHVRDIGEHVRIHWFLRETRTDLLDRDLEASDDAGVAASRE